MLCFFQADEYAYQIHFMIKIIDEFTVGPDDVQFGAVTFSSQAWVKFPLDKHANRSSLVDDINSWSRISK